MRSEKAGEKTEEGRGQSAFAEEADASESPDTKKEMRAVSWWLIVSVSGTERTIKKPVQWRNTAFQRSR